MTYSQLLESIYDYTHQNQMDEWTASKQRLRNLNVTKHIPNYYSQLIVHTGDILKDIEKRSQGVVARDLGLTQPQLSTLLKLLKELYYNDYSIHQA